MKTELYALRDGTMDFNEFVRCTTNEWEQLARRVFRRWRLPAGIEVRDIAQEMMLSAWRAATRWIEATPAERVMSIEKYVVWTACAEAKRWAHTQRNSYRRAPGQPGRFPVAWSQYCRDETQTMEERLGSEENSGEVMVLGMEALTGVIEQLPEIEQLAVYAWLSTGSIEEAAALLKADVRRCSALNLWTDGAARRLVNRSIATAALVASA